MAGPSFQGHWRSEGHISHGTSHAKWLPKHCKNQHKRGRARTLYDWRRSCLRVFKPVSEPPLLCAKSAPKFQSSKHVRVIFASRHAVSAVDKLADIAPSKMRDDLFGVSAYCHVRSPFVKTRTDRLLGEIEAGALNSSTPIADVLRKVIALGGRRVQPSFEIGLPAN